MVRLWVVGVVGGGGVGHNVTVSLWVWSKCKYFFSFFSEMDSDAKIKGLHLRGNNFSVSQDGRCPRCGTPNVLFVILDE